MPTAGGSGAPGAGIGIGGMGIAGATGAATRPRLRLIFSSRFWLVPSNSVTGAGIDSSSAPSSSIVTLGRAGDLGSGWRPE